MTCANPRKQRWDAAEDTFLIIHELYFVSRTHNWEWCVIQISLDTPEQRRRLKNPAYIKSAEVGYEIRWRRIRGCGEKLLKTYSIAILCKMMILQIHILLSNHMKTNDLFILEKMAISERTKLKLRFLQGLRNNLESFKCCSSIFTCPFLL